ncbi:MAG TPA: GGDEF domain-containing protein [Rhodocyclaceae bacterium]
MKYDDSMEKSAEYLRLAVQHMARQATALHPISYAVWYEYVSGRNAALRAAIDRQLAAGSVLDEQMTAELYRQYIAEAGGATAQMVSQGLQKVIADIAHSASQAGDEADKFGNVLEQWSENRSEAPSGGDEGPGELLQHTRVMQGAIGSLKGRLADSHREIEQLREEVKKVREESLVDGLTGLANRRRFDLVLADCLAQAGAENQGPSLLMADIDLFKQVNDSYGHLFGDKVIRAVAQILKANVKGKDTAARYGGEEFVILLPDTSVGGAQRLAEQIRATVERMKIKRVEKNEIIANITISLGVACFRDGESAEDFIARADSALYDSKSQGRNRVTVAAA